MARPVSAPFVVRPRRMLKWLVPALILTTAVGCGHRRSAMRPRFLTPAPVVTAPCPTTVSPGDPGPATLSSPTLEPAFPAAEVPASLPGPSSDRAVVTPPTPGLPDDPGELTPIPPNTPRATPSNDSGLQLNAPNTTLNRPRRIPTARLRQTTLRERLRPFVNDPEDLFQPPKADRPWRYVVLHHSAHASGSLDEIDREHRKVLGWDGCGYHFVIGNGSGSPDGRVEVARRWSEQKNGVHCRDGKTPDVNEYGVGICLVGDLDQAPPTARQIAAAQALVAYLGDRYQIPADHVGTHARLALSPTACPGKHFPVQAILGGRDLAQR